MLLLAFAVDFVVVDKSCARLVMWEDKSRALKVCSSVVPIDCETHGCTNTSFVGHCRYLEAADLLLDDRDDLAHVGGIVNLLGGEVASHDGHDVCERLSEGRSLADSQTCELNC